MEHVRWFLRSVPAGHEEVVGSGIEALAGLSFPVNPQLYHRPGVVYVEFPAYENDLPEVRRLLESSGLDEPLRLEARPPSYVPVL